MEPKLYAETLVWRDYGYAYWLTVYDQRFPERFAALSEWEGLIRIRTSWDVKMFLRGEYTGWE
jgi:hypothetical protein